MEGEVKNQEAADIENRLRDFERNCETLYPAIRFFGLCGADTRYVIAAMEIGRLLGKIKEEPSPAGQEANVDVAKIAQDAGRAAVREVAEWIRNSGEVASRTGRGLREDLAEMVKKLAE